MNLVKIVPFIFLISMFINTANAQFNDNFNDGDFISNPLWFGDDSCFVVNDGCLQVYDEQAGKAALFTISKLDDYVELSFQIKLAFAPSSNNNVKIWLIAKDYPPTTGVFLQIGENGLNDAPQIIYKSIDTSIVILRGIDGGVAKPFCKDFKIRKDDSKWSIFVKNADDNFFNKEAQADFYYNIGTTNYFGIECQYTKSNSTKFYFDDISVQEINYDTIKPSVKQLAFSENNTLIVSYSEPVAGNNQYAYYLKNDFSNPVKVEKINAYKYKLFFEKEIYNEENHLCIQNIADAEANIIKDTCLSFFISHLTANDFILNEIMFDVNPPPPCLSNNKYIEIKNNLNLCYDLSGFKIYLNDELQHVFSETLCEPRAYFLLEDFVLKGINLPAEGNIKLISSRNILLDEISYDKRRYQTEEKAKGGYSLERNKNKFFESIDPCGGTPGFINSIDTIDIPIAELPVLDDLVFTEILFYAKDSISDYVEIYNKSDKVIDLYDLCFVEYKEDEILKNIALKTCIITPNEYKLLTKDTAFLTRHFIYYDKNAFVEISNMPSLNNNCGVLGLINSEMALVDKVYYSNNMHLRLIREKSNIALEKISLLRTSLDTANWHSAASTYNYGSPGVINSQSLVWEYEPELDFDVSLSTRLFTPNNDGIDDNVSICYSFPEHGYLLTISVYDVNGVHVKEICNNSLAEQTGCVSWDGNDENGLSVKQGSYIVLFRAFSEKGKKLHKKLVLSVI